MKSDDFYLITFIFFFFFFRLKREYISITLFINYYKILIYCMHLIVKIYYKYFKIKNNI